MARKDAYRVSPPHSVPTSWPFHQGTCSQNASNIANVVEAECIRVCVAHRIAIHSCSFESIWRKDMEETTRRDCWIIDTRDQDTTTWKAAAHTLWDFMKGMGLTSDAIGLEIRNPILMHADYSCCLPADENLLDYIRAVQPEIEALVDMQLPDYTSIAYHGRSPKHSQDQAKPTLMIFVKPGKLCSFQLVSDRAMAIFSKPAYEHIALHIEILAGEISLSQDVRCRPRLQRGLSLQPKNGASIGVRGKPGETGSLGGWLELTHSKTGKVYRCCMTAYHCIAQGARDEVDEADNDFSGIGLYGDQCNIQVVYPSEHDARYTRQHYQNALAVGKDVQESTRMISILDQLKNQGSIGRVLFASGHTKTKGDQPSRIDWAVFDSPSTFKANSPAPVPVADPSDLYDDVSYNPTPTDRVTDTAAMTSDMWVVRQGRTSLRQGLVNKIKRKVQWEVKKYGTSYENEVISLQSGVDFAAGGDSGSWVYNEQMQLVGVCIGTDIKGGDNVGLVTPISVVFKDIEEQTKCRVSLAT